MMLPLLIMAATAPASQAVELVGRKEEAGKVFPYIEQFLKLPAADHTDFTVAYYFKRDGRPSNDAGAVLTDGDARVPLPVAGDGRFAVLPTLEQVRAHATISFNVPDRTRMDVRIGLTPVVLPATSMDAEAVGRAIRQANAAIHHLAGPFSVVAPKLKNAVFDGAEGGTAILTDGTITPLPIKKDGPYYDPSKLRNVVTLTFTKAAQHIDIAP